LPSRSRIRRCIPSARIRTRRASGSPAVPQRSAPQGLGRFATRTEPQGGAGCTDGARTRRGDRLPHRARGRDRATELAALMTIDIISFARDVLVDPETNRPFVLYPAQERFLREAFRLTPDGRLLYPDAIYGAIKKSGKTTTAGISVNYVGAVLAPRF